MPFIEAIGDVTTSGELSGSAAFVVRGALGGVYEPGVYEEGVYVEHQAEGYATVTADATPVTLSLPGVAGVLQEVDLEVYVGGVLVSPDDLVGSWNVTRSLDQPIQRATFTTFRGALGTLGTQDIDIYGVYIASGGTKYRYPLLIGGVVHGVSRSVDPNGGYYDTYNIVDRGARIQRNPVTLVLFPGHGHTRGRVVRKILQGAGETAFKIVDFDPGEEKVVMTKAVQLIDADPIAASQDLLDIEGRLLNWDRFGNATNRKLKPGAWLAVAQTITADDILDLADFQEVQPYDVITDVIATGTEQIVRDDDATEPCGSTVGEQRVEVIKTFSPSEANGRQETNCTITSQTVAHIEREQLFSLTIFKRTTYCGVVIREETEQWGWTNPTAARYQWDTVGTAFECLANVYLYDGTVNGSEEGYRWRVEKWQLLSRVVKSYYYNVLGFRGPSANVTDTFFEWRENGQFQGSIQETYAWHHQASATKQWNPTTTTYEMIDNKQVRGDGTGTAESFATFKLIERITERFNPDDIGFVERIVTEAERWSPARGATYSEPDPDKYLFADGTTSRRQDEEFFVTDTQEQLYVEAGENAHNRIVTNQPTAGRPEITIESQEGARPAIDYLPGWEPVDDAAFTDEDAEPVMASLAESRTIKVQVTAPELLGRFLPRSVKTNFPWAENLDELFNAAAFMIEESLADDVGIVLAANFAISEGQKVIVDYSTAGYSAGEVCHVRGIQWSGGGVDQPILTTLGLKRYVDRQ